MRWTKSGDNWMAVTWQDDTQVIYLLEHDTTLTARGQWLVRRKVCGAADRTGYVIGVQTDLDKAKWVAEEDARLPL